MDKMNIGTVLYEVMLRCDNLDIPEQLYIRKNGQVTSIDGGLRIEKNSSVKFNTYYNSFSVGKWRRYTSARGFFLKLRYCGKLGIRVYDLGSEKQIHLQEFESQNVQEVNIPIYAPSQVIAFDLTARSDSFIYYAAYCCRTEAQWKLLNIAMCTFRRETYVYKNAGNIFQAMQNYNALSGRCRFFIVDNGQTLDRMQLNYDFVHLFQQDDLGGTAGNMRALLEIEESGAEEDSFVVFMDDDVDFLPGMLQRLQSFVSLLSDDYLSHEIAGAMFTMEEKNIQHESGAIFTGLGNISVNCGFDMCDAKFVEKNEIEGKPEYGAGFLRVIPQKLLMEKGYFFPAFMRYDDVEYGLRLASEPIRLNGIHVWHDSFCYKDNSSVMYYEYRNSLIVEAVYRRMSFIRKLVRINRMVLWSCLCMHYNYGEAIVKGVLDFLKGPEWLENADALSIHEKISCLNYKYSPCNKPMPSDSLLSNRWSRSDFKGKSQVYIINELAATEYQVSRSAGKFIRVLGLLLYLDILYSIKAYSTGKRYYSRFPTCCGKEYWIKKLR